MIVYMKIVYTIIIKDTNNDFLAFDELFVWLGKGQAMH